MSETYDPVLEALQKKLKDTEELTGVDSLQTLYVLEELSALLKERKKTLEAVNVDARIKVLRKKLDLAEPEKQWKPQTKQQERRQMIWVVAGFFLASILMKLFDIGGGFGIYSIANGCAAIGMLLLAKYFDAPLVFRLGIGAVWVAVVLFLPKIHLSMLPTAAELTTAIQLCKNGKSKEGMVAFDKALSGCPAKSHAKAVVLLARAACLIQEGKYGETIDDCDDVIAIERVANAYFFRAVSYAQLKKYSDAEQDFHSLLSCDASELKKLGTDNILEAYKGIAEEAHDSGDADRLVEQYKQELSRI